MCGIFSKLLAISMICSILTGLRRKAIWAFFVVDHLDRFFVFLGVDQFVFGFMGRSGGPGRKSCSAGHWHRALSRLFGFVFFHQVVDALVGFSGSGGGSGCFPRYRPKACPFSPAFGQVLSSVFFRGRVGGLFWSPGKRRSRNTGAALLQSVAVRRRGISRTTRWIGRTTSPVPSSGVKYIIMWL